MIFLFDWLSSVVCANVIAIFALVAAISSLWMQRKNITVYFEPNLEVLSSSNVLFNNVNNVIEAPVIFKARIDIVNPSPIDIAFFDLRAFNPKNINHHIITRKTFPCQLSMASVSIKNNLGEFNQEIPDRNHGILKANSFTCLDILIHEKDTKLFGENIYLTFKISKKNWVIKDPFAVTNRSKFKMYGFNYHISGWEKILKNQPSDQDV